jgi:hypothetical protein
MIAFGFLACSVFLACHLNGLKRANTRFALTMARNSAIFFYSADNLAKMRMAVLRFEILTSSQNKSKM